ncbi:MAG: PRC-barrel domain-containing protein [Candidatus Thermoplasmatota archaeon]|nr:PRC-barrel domain-containing protein [Candidatus Thermoplasmatota archaeon]MCL5666025.1 PRC-barrel domain-containing protein [Candidatus Thermoplasmatota archaeon]
MAKKFTNDLINMSVVTTTGQLVGRLDNFVFDTETGNVKHALIVPKGEVDFSNIQADKEGRYVVSMKALKSIEDIIVVDLTKL